MPTCKGSLDDEISNDSRKGRLTSSKLRFYSRLTRLNSDFRVLMFGKILKIIKRVSKVKSVALILNILAVD